MGLLLYSNIDVMYIKQSFFCFFLCIHLIFIDKISVENCFDEL